MKTTWFTPFKAIIGEDKVADIVDRGWFAMQTANEDTECIFMDEWDTGRFIQINLFSVLYAHYDLQYTL